MTRIRLAIIAVALATPSFAKDCTPVETAPGVKSKPAGCADLGREAPPKKADDRLRGQDGWIVNRDGTRIRVFGGVRTDIGVGSR